jgi:MFS family permease
MWEALPMRGLGDRLLQSSRAYSETFRNPGLRRLLLAGAGSLFGSWAYLVALAVYAYAQGGAGAVALIGVLRLIPAAVLAPFLATLADRFPRRLIMVVSDVLRAGLMAAATAAIAGGAPAWTVYTLVTASTLAGGLFGPAQAALLPELASSPSELATANIASGTLESVASFLGPAIGGFLLAATSPEVVFALNGVSFLWSAALVVGIRVAQPTAEPEGHAESTGLGAMEGFRTILRNRDVGVLIGLYAAQTLVAGALGVLVVVTALDLLDGGPQAVGLLDSAMGIGGIVGAVAALALTARGRLASDFGVGLALFGAVVLIGFAPSLAMAIGALAVVGIGNSLVDIAAITLLQRSVANEVLGRVVGIVEAVVLASLALGALVAPLLVHAFSTRTAIVVVGAALPALTLAAWPQLRRLDASTSAPKLTGLLRGVEILALLPLPALERLAAALTEVRLPAGAVVIREGEPGDRFYILAEGEVEVEGNVLRPGSSFGEIALLRDVPRTATVTTRTDVVLQALDRDDFLSAVTGNEPSSAAADAVIARRLGELRADLSTEHGAA